MQNKCTLKSGSSVCNLQSLSFSSCSMQLFWVTKYEHGIAEMRMLSGCVDTLDWKE